MTVEFRIQRPDKSEIWVLARKQVAFAASGPDALPRATTGVFAVRDITDRKAAEERLRISEIRYRRLFEAAHDGVLLLDPVTAKIVDANPFMTRLLGYPHEQLVGKELYEIGLLKDQAMSQDMFRKLKTDHPSAMKTCLLKAILDAIAKSRWLQTSMTRMAAPSSSATFATSRIASWPKPWRCRTRGCSRP